MQPKIGVIGLGYVGLPLALAFATEFEGCVGFDVDSTKVKALREGVDVNREGLDDALVRAELLVTDAPSDLDGCNFFVVGVPTPVDENHVPDLRALLEACRTVGSRMRSGCVVVFESTVYPGVTEDICGPELERASGLRRSEFKLAYSPERMNPGDGEHTLAKIVKVVSGEDRETLELVAAVYERIVPAGVHRAPSIKVAEAAKVIENTQRDLNIALMNELAIIFDRMGIRTKDVLDAAATKWNFNRYSPGLVGGHCIGVDPFYLTSKAQQLGYHPQVILAGRRINDGMGQFIAQKTVKLMVNAGIPVKGAKIGILGLTFKENVADIRNSRIPDIVEELREFGADPIVHDPCADASAAREEYGIEIVKWGALRDLDALIVAVAHQEIVDRGTKDILARMKRKGVLVDVKSILDRTSVPKSIVYWSL